MKNLIYKTGVVTVLLIAAGIAGCKKELTLNPLDQLSDAAFWQTPNDFKLAANAFYLYERTFTAVVSDGAHSDTRGDFIAGSSPNTYSDGTYVAPVTDGDYQTNYTRIHNIDYMLAKAAAYSNQAAIAQYVAEAKFFRAYVYFDMLQKFGSAVIITTPLTTTSPELTSANNTRDQLVDFIIADLNAAIPNLPLQNAIPTTDQGRVSQGAAQGFLSRVALYEGTWQEFRSNATRANSLLTMAVAAANSVITSQQYSLFKPAALGDSAQKYMFILENQKSNPANIVKAANTEYMLSNRYDQTIRIINFNVTKTVVANVLWPTAKFADMYLCKDGLPVTKSPLFQGYSTMISEFQNRDNRMRYNLMPARRPYWTNSKYRIDWTGDAADVANAFYQNLIPTFGDGYQNQKWGTERQLTDTQEGYDYPVIRYAEVLLNYAEATFELNGSISDADLDKSLNLVRLRVNTDNAMPKLSNGFVTANGLDMRTEIRRERNIELYLEGFRIDDLKRWKTAETEMPMSLVGVHITGTEFQTLWPGAASASQLKDAQGRFDVEDATKRNWQQKHYLYPFPTHEIAVNPNLAQNPGW